MFSLDRLLSHIDPGSREESEEFVRRIDEQRHIGDVAGFIFKWHPEFAQQYVNIVRGMS